LYLSPTPVINFLKQQGIDVPFKHISALVDIGSTTTAIDEKIAKELELIVRDIGRFGTTGGAIEQYMYDINVEITLDDKKGHTGSFEIQTVGINMESQNCLAIVGRDILQHAVFNYDGPGNSYSLNFTTK
jgi:hypothetical protein